MVELLLNALRTYFTAGENESNPSSDSICVKSSKDETILQLDISNKYFSASLSIQELVSITSNGHKTFSENEDNDTKEDGIIITFPLSTTNLDYLTSVHKDADDSNQCGDTLRLCVAVSSNLSQDQASQSYEKQYSDRVLWCLDHGYEYIEADLSEEGITTGHDDREKDGFARIVEAICSTVWSSAIMYPKKKNKIKETMVVHEDQSDHVEEHIKTLDNNDSSKCEKEGTGTSAVLESHEDQTNDDTPPSRDLQGGNAEQNELLFDKLEHLMKEAGSIRESSKRGNLSDEQRRKRAGETATMLLGLLDQIGFDEESESDRSSCGEEEE